MRKLVITLTLICTATAISYSQNCGPTDSIKVKYLEDLRGQVTSRNFNEIAFRDFSKFVIGDDNQFGRAVNYASIQIDKPKATLNLYHKTKSAGFFNFLLSGGFENDLFSVVSAKKPASSFSSTFSYSWLPWKSYKYYPSEKHKLWSTIISKFDEDIYTGCLDIMIKDMYTKIKDLNKLINDNNYDDEDEIREDSINQVDLVNSLSQLAKLTADLEKVNSEKKRRTLYTDSLALSAKWSTRKWFWITGAGTYGGVSFKHYNRNSSNKELLSDQSSFTRSFTVSANLLYKSVHNEWYSKVLNNTLITGGFSLERRNNFSSFTSSEYKAVEKTDSASTNTQYSRSQTITVYTDSLIEYNATTKWFELTRLLGDEGTFGVRNRITFENPKNTQLLDQTNWEVGLIYNTTSKKDKEVTKFSVELFVNFKDLSGNNVKEADKPQNWKHRHTIGVRTNIPFRFLSL